RRRPARRHDRDDRACERLRGADARGPHLASARHREARLGTVAAQLAVPPRLGSGLRALRPGALGPGHRRRRGRPLRADRRAVTSMEDVDRYRAQSRWTDPGRWTARLREIPPEPDAVVRAVSGLLQHPMMAPMRGIEVPAVARDDQGLRAVEAILDRVLA